MTTLPISSTGISRFSLESFLCDYHIYREQWELWIGKMLLLERDPRKLKDSHAVAMKNSREAAVGCVQFNLAPAVSVFLMRSVTNGDRSSEVSLGGVGGLWIQNPLKYLYFGLKTIVDQL